MFPARVIGSIAAKTHSNGKVNTVMVSHSYPLHWRIVDSCKDRCSFGDVIWPAAETAPGNVGGVEWWSCFGPPHTYRCIGVLRVNTCAHVRKIRARATERRISTVLLSASSSSPSSPRLQLVQDLREEGTIFGWQVPPISFMRLA